MKKYEHPLWYKILLVFSTSFYILLFFMFQSADYNFNIIVSLIMIGVAFIFGAATFLSLIKGYFEITHEELIVYTFLTNKIKLNSITIVSEDKDFYYFSSPEKQIRITRKSIDKSQLQDFEKFFQEFQNKVKHRNNLA